MGYDESSKTKGVSEVRWGRGLLERRAKVKGLEGVKCQEPKTINYIRSKCKKKNIVREEVIKSMI
jgi:hypothetical protein